MSAIMTDTDLMPFGKYKGMPLQDVPASYLHWLWTNERDPMRLKTATDPLAAYIAANLGALQKEHPDGIW